MPSLAERFKNSWNAFMGRDPTYGVGYAAGSSYRPDRARFTRNSAQSVVGFIYNRIAVDVATVDFRHVRLDENDHYKEDIDSYLNDCLKYEANLDQTARAFIQDIVVSMFDEGSVAIVPVECEVNSSKTMVTEANIYQMRAGKVVTWYPESVRVNVYNQKTGKHEEIVIAKTLVSIIENPFYSIMNEPNSTLQRLLRTISKLDAFNDQNASGKLDLIIQLPYVIKSELRRKEAEKRRKEIEDQLTTGKYGVAYTDGTEHVIQLNRSLENNLWTQVKELTEQLYSQLGLTASILDGTADEQTMTNYYSRSIEPICSAITGEMLRKFLTVTARSQKQSIMFFRNPFKLVPVEKVADIADKFTRNEILSSNEFRSIIGYKPSDDPRANELRNKNINTSNEELKEEQDVGGEPDEEGKMGLLGMGDKS